MFENFKDEAATSSGYILHQGSENILTQRAIKAKYLKKKFQWESYNTF